MRDFKNSWRFGKFQVPTIFDPDADFLTEASESPPGPFIPFRSERRRNIATSFQICFDCESGHLSTNVHCVEEIIECFRLNL